MVPPVRWYMLLSSWIFILSLLYPILKISTYPLNLIALVGCFELILNPYNTNAIKNLYILFLHIAPFYWIPYDFSPATIYLSISTIGIYLVTMLIIRKNPIDAYKDLLIEKHTTVFEFTCDRFGIGCENKVGLE